MIESDLEVGKGLKQGTACMIHFGDLDSILAVFREGRGNMA